MKSPLRKLVFASLKKHLTQNIAAVLMMSLCFCFVTAATLMYDSQDRLTKWEGYQRCTAAHAMLLDAEPEMWQKMQTAFPIYVAGKVFSVGSHDLGADFNHMKVTLGAMDASALSISGLALQSGTWPKEAGEIAISKRSLSRLGQSTELGSQLSLDLSPLQGSVGGEKVTKTFRLVGTYLDYTENMNNYQMGYYYNSDMTQFSFDNLPFDSCIPTAYITQDEAEQISNSLGGSKTSYYMQFANQSGGLISDWDLITLNEQVIGPFFLNLIDPTQTLRYRDELPTDQLPYFYRNINMYSWDDRLRVLGENAIRLAIGLVAGVLSVLLLGSGIASSFEIRLDSRRQQTGLIRAIGASRWQAIRLMLLEALLLLIPSLFIGALLGSLAAKMSLDHLQSILGSPYTFTFPDISIMLWGWGICCFFLFLFSLRPMLRLTRKSPIALLNQQGNVRAARKIAPKKRLPKHPLRFLAHRYVRLHLFRHIFPILVLSFCLALIMVVAGFYQKNMAVYKGNEVKDEDLITLVYWYTNGFSYTNDFENDIWAMNPAYIPEMSNVPAAVFAKVESLPGVIAVTAAKNVEWPVLLLQPDQDTDYIRNIDDGAYNGEAEYNRLLQDRKKAAQYVGMPENLHPWVPQSLMLPEAGILGVNEQSLALMKNALLAGSIDMEAIQKGEAVLLGASSYFKRPDPYGWDSGLTNQRKGADIYNNDAFRVGDKITFGKVFIDEENGKTKWKSITKTARICGLVNTNPGNIYTTMDRFTEWGFPGGIAYMQIRLKLDENYDSTYRSLDMLAQQYSLQLYSKRDDQINSRKSFEGSVFLYHAILYMLGIMGLALLVSNTWSRLSVRESEISLLRAVGMDGTKVLRLLLGECIRDGLWAAAIGTILGVIAIALINSLTLYGEDVTAVQHNIAYYLSLIKDVSFTPAAIAFFVFPLTGLFVSIGWIRRLLNSSIVSGIRQVE